MRAPLLLILLTSCVRHLTPVDPPKTVEARPTFLGESSGLYRIVQANDRTGSIEGGSLLFSQGNDFFSIANASAAQGEENALFSFSGTLSENQACARGRFSLNIPNLPLQDSPAALHIGLGAATILLAAPPQLQAALHCPEYVSVAQVAAGAVDATGLTPEERACLGEGEPSFVAPMSICAFRARRECDFDSTISGVFEVDVEAGDSAGTCGAPPLAGKRQWLVTTANGANEMAVLGVNPEGTALEMGVLATWDAGAGRVSSARFLPLEGSLWDEKTSKLTGTIRIDGETLRFDDVQLVRSLDGCTEHYTARGTRLRGSKIGASCPAYSRFSCPLSFETCPKVDPSLGGSYTFGAVKSETTTGCPVQTCELTFDALELCDEPSRIVANDGCPKVGGVFRNVVLSKKQAGNKPCIALACEDAPECEEDGHHDAKLVTGLACAENGTVHIAKNQGRCFRVSCTSAPDSACPSDVPCTQFHAKDRGEAVSSADACPHNLCELDANTLSITPQQTAIIRSGGYNVVSLARVGTSNTFTIEIASNQSNGCPATDLDLTSFACPDRGTYDPAYDVCAAPGPHFSVAQGLYRSASGGLCVGAVAGSNHRLLSMPPMCNSPAIPCCNSQIAPDGSVPLACVSPPSPAVMVSVDVTNNRAYSVLLDLVSVPSPVNHLQYLAPPGNSTLTMPRAVAHRTGYTLAITAPLMNCLFDGTDAQHALASEVDVPTVICN